MWESINNAWASWLEVAIPLVNFWPDTKETNKASFFEVNDVFTVSCTTFSVNHNWIPEIMFLRLLLSSHNLFKNSALIIFWGSVKMQVLGGNWNWTNKWDVLNFFFSNNTWVLLKTMQHWIKEGTMVANNSWTVLPIIIWHPVFPKELFITHFGSFVINPWASTGCPHNISAWEIKVDPDHPSSDTSDRLSHILSINRCSCPCWSEEKHEKSTRQF